MNPITDPLQLWRKALARLEGTGNAVANKAMGSRDFASALHQVANASIGMQHTFEKVLATYFRKLDLPSRKEIAELTAAVQRIEARLDTLTGPGGKAPAAPRPARTRRPAAEAMASQPARKRATRKA